MAKLKLARAEPPMSAVDAPSRALAVEGFSAVRETSLRVLVKVAFPEAQTG
jgi:hypothetical protein